MNRSPVDADRQTRTSDKPCADLRIFRLNIGQAALSRSPRDKIELRDTSAHDTTDEAIGLIEAALEKGSDRSSNCCREGRAITGADHVEIVDPDREQQDRVIGIHERRGERTRGAEQPIRHPALSYAPFGTRSIRIAAPGCEGDSAPPAETE
ncbi:hypothetical protein ACFS32_09005 [Novosphingobium pokkalii]|uniref:hypothetical protein n=1 Tax=Novosphingobium pokkalii TaxID=1770194 RepID=UPI0036333C71